MMDDIELEMETRERVSASLSKIEMALADWEDSRKPKRLEKKILFLRRSHKLLSDWMVRSLKGRKDERSAGLRLRLFHDICDELRGGVP